MPGRSLVELMQKQNEGSVEAQLSEDAHEAGTALEFDRRNSRRTRIVSKSPAYMYAYRPGLREDCADIGYSSPYEFIMCWEIQTPAYVTWINDLEQEKKDNDRFQAALTLNGVHKLAARQSNPCVEFEPGEDFQVKAQGTAFWRPLPDVP